METSTIGETWVGFSPDGGSLLAGAGRLLRAFDLPRALAGAPRGEAIFAAAETLPAFALQPGGRLVAAGDVGGAVHLIDRLARREVASLPAALDHLTALAFSEDGRTLFAGDANGHVVAIDLDVPGA